MTPWKEHHYARADEFVRLVAAALARAGGSANPFVPPPPANIGSTPPFAASASPAAPPKPVTAAALFKSIPWKK